MEDKSAIILGAGMAGLTAAYELANAGWTVTVLEARPRIGGRVHTHQDGGKSAPIEAGAEFIHGEHVETWRWVKRAGLAVHEVPDRHWQRREGQLVEDESFYDELTEAMETIDRSRPDQSVTSFLRRNRDMSASAKRLLREYVEGFHAADPKRMSLAAFAQAEEAAEKTDGTRQFRLTAGYGALLEWFHEELREREVRVHLGHVAKRVGWSRHSVTVQTTAGNEERVFSASRLIVTLPLGVLKEAGPGGVAFEPRLARVQETLAGLEMGNVRKVVLTFNARFWPVANFGFAHSLDRWFPTWWADERALRLTGWAGGPRADRMKGAESSKLLRQSVGALARLFGLSPARIRAATESMQTHDWGADPFSLGAYSYVGVGALDAPQRLAEPIDGTLYFAGEATAELGQQGTVHGAMGSGRRAAETIVTDL